MVPRFWQLSCYIAFPLQCDYQSSSESVFKAGGARLQVHAQEQAALVDAAVQL